MGQNKSNLSHDQMLEHLVSGYITSQKYGDIAICQYPTSLLNLIVSFLGNLLIRFDTFHHSHSNLVFENGKSIKVDKCPKSFSFTTIACSLPFKSGVNEVLIQYNGKRREIAYDPIGIISNINNCAKQESWIYHMDAVVYAFYGLNIVGSDSNTFQGRVGRLDKGDILKLRIDCHAWKLLYFINDEMIGKPVYITPNSTGYYLVISLQSANVEYRLIC